MKREEMLALLEDISNWDVVIIGGGATGMGTAVDAASRGYRTLLLEKGDFGQGTSSRSTKLIHGGVRYLQQGNISLVLEALKERGILRRNAPHLVHNLPFVVPNYDWWEGPFYGIGMKLYDLLAGKEGFGRSEIISYDETLQRIPNVETRGLNGGVKYYDGQFDDSRLVINLARTAAEQGACLVNYMPVTGFLRQDGLISGVLARESDSGREYRLKARVVINASGPFSDQVCRLDNPEMAPLIRPSQGVHIILDKSFLPGDSAIMVPHTDDGRVLFAIPWHDRIVVGTTDTPLDTIADEPLPRPEEIDFLIEHAARYLERDPSVKDIRSMFAGIRPLVADAAAENTAALSRDHTIHIARSGLITIAGGKWTTYRKMAEDVLEQAILVGNLKPQPCITQDLQIHGFHAHADQFGDLADYGADAVEIQALAREEQSWQVPLLQDPVYHPAEVVWAVRHEMARTLTDVLSRRRRILLLDARQAIEVAPQVARIMAAELGRPEEWVEQQLAEFTKLAQNYLPPL